MDLVKKANSLIKRTLIEEDIDVPVMSTVGDFEKWKYEEDIDGVRCDFVTGKWVVELEKDGMHVGRGVDSDIVGDVQSCSGILSVTLV